LGFETVGQLSQASPSVSPSELIWVGFGMTGQLSWSPTFGARKPLPAQIPSSSWSLSASPGHTSHTSPEASPSALAWFWFVTVGQLSHESPSVSPSELVWFGLVTVG